MINRNTNSINRDLSGSVTFTDSSNSYIPPLSLVDISHNLYMIYLELCKEGFDDGFDDVSLNTSIQGTQTEISLDSTPLWEDTASASGTIIEYLDRSNRRRPLTPRPYSTRSEFKDDLSMPVQSPSGEVIVDKEYVEIDVELRSLADLLRLIEDHPKISNVEYNIDMDILYRIHDPLRDLNSMIGMKKTKELYSGSSYLLCPGFPQNGYWRDRFHAHCHLWTSGDW